MGQFKHVALEFAIGASEYFPKGQYRQYVLEGAPKMVAYLPAPQAKHALNKLAPGVDE